MNNNLKKTDILIIAGEKSGDNLGAALINSLKKSNHTLNITAMGGKAIKKTGVNLIFDSENMGIIGFIEIIKHIGVIWAARKTILNQLKTNPPKLLILIDYPGFNLMIAKHAKKHNIKVLYYVSPQIWAWRSGRIHKLKKHIDHMAVLFPFEQAIYQKAGIPVTYVGHPLTQKINQYKKMHLDTSKKLNLNPDQPIIALLPGSRQQEIHALLPTIIKATKTIKQQIPNAQFILTQASSIPDNEILPLLPSHIQVIKDNTYAVLNIAHAAICASGTATLECALFQVPLVIIYKTAWITYLIGKQVIKTPFIGLCSIVAEEQLAQEFIQHEMTSKNTSHEIIQLIQNTSYRNKILRKLNALKEKLTEKNTTQTITNLVETLLNN